MVVWVPAFVLSLRTGFSLWRFVWLRTLNSCSAEREMNLANQNADAADRSSETAAVVFVLQMKTEHRHAALRLSLTFAPD